MKEQHDTFLDKTPPVQSKKTDKLAIEYLLAGASAVQVGTATFIHPEAMPTIIEGLDSFCQQRHIKHIANLIGQVRDSNLSAEAVLHGYST